MNPIANMQTSIPKIAPVPKVRWTHTRPIPNGMRGSDTTKQINSANILCGKRGQSIAQVRKAITAVTNPQKVTGGICSTSPAMNPPIPATPMTASNIENRFMENTSTWRVRISNLESGAAIASGKYKLCLVDNLIPQNRTTASRPTTIVSSIA